jgi:prolipoprotein diacylglyceryltransferase
MSAKAQIETAISLHKPQLDSFAENPGNFFKCLDGGVGFTGGKVGGKKVASTFFIKWKM